MGPQLDFRRQFGWEMVENTVVYRRRLRARRGTLGDHELMTAPKYCGNGLLMRINGGGSRSPTRSRYATTKGEIVNFLQGGIADALREYSYVLSVIKLMFLTLIPNN